jgi:hypothetical protein
MSLEARSVGEGESGESGEKVPGEAAARMPIVERVGQEAAGGGSGKRRCGIRTHRAHDAVCAFRGRCSSLLPRRRCSPGSFLSFSGGTEKEEVGPRWSPRDSRPTPPGPPAFLQLAGARLFGRILKIAEAPDPPRGRRRLTSARCCSPLGARLALDRQNDAITISSNASRGDISQLHSCAPSHYTAY